MTHFILTCFVFGCVVLLLCLCFERDDDDEGEGDLPPSNQSGFHKGCVNHIMGLVMESPDLIFLF